MGKTAWIVGAVAVIGLLLWANRRKPAEVATPRMIKPPQKDEAALPKAIEKAAAKTAPKAPAQAKAHSGSFYDQYLKELDPTRKENKLAQLVDKATGGTFGDVSSFLGAIGQIPSVVGVG